MEQIVKYFVFTLFESEESLGARCHFAIASCGVRQVPFLEMRSLSVARFTHVVNVDGTLAWEGVLISRVERVLRTNAKTSQRRSLPRVTALVALY